MSLLEWLGIASKAGFLSKLYHLPMKHDFSEGSPSQEAMCCANVDVLRPHHFLFMCDIESRGKTGAMV